MTARRTKEGVVSLAHSRMSLSTKELRRVTENCVSEMERTAAVEVQADLIRTLPHVVARATALKKTSSRPLRRPNRPK